MSADIGIFGLTTQAINLALNLALKQQQVTVGHRSSDLIKDCKKQADKKEVGEQITGTKDYAEFCDSLASPKKVILMAKPGSSVEKHFGKILPLLSSGDVLVDTSSEGYETCLRRSKEAEEKGIHYMTMGILGSDKEALKGCGMMLSGPREGYDNLEVVLKKAVKEIDYEPCLAYVGSSVSASYVMMVLNGIMNAEEQVLAETYNMLLAAGFTNEEVSKSIATWNKDDLESPLLEAVCTILKKKDQDVEGCDPSDDSLIDRVIDCPALLNEAATLLRETNEHHTGTPSITAAIEETFIAAKREERAKAVRMLEGPEFDWMKLDHVQLVEDLRNNFVCCQLSIFAQAFALLRTAGDAYEWSLKLGEIARVIQGMAFCRNGLLTLVKESMEEGESNVLLNETVAEVLSKKQLSWRRAVALSIVAGCTAPVMVSCLAYMDTMKRDKLPQNLVIAQRDFYASATFERTDMARGMSYHCRWTKDHN